MNKIQVLAERYFKNNFTKTGSKSGLSNSVSFLAQLLRRSNITTSPPAPTPAPPPAPTPAPPPAPPEPIVRYLIDNFLEEGEVSVLNHLPSIIYDYPQTANVGVWAVGFEYLNNTQELTGQECVPVVSPQGLVFKVDNIRRDTLNYTPVYGNNVPFYVHFTALDETCSWAFDILILRKDPSAYTAQDNDFGSVRLSYDAVTENYTLSFNNIGNTTGTALNTIYTQGNTRVIEKTSVGGASGILEITCPGQAVPNVLVAQLRTSDNETVNWSQLFSTNQDPGYTDPFYIGIGGVVTSQGGDAIYVNDSEHNAYGLVITKLDIQRWS